MKRPSATPDRVYGNAQAPLWLGGRSRTSRLRRNPDGHQHDEHCELRHQGAVGVRDGVPGEARGRHSEGEEVVSEPAAGPGVGAGGNAARGAAGLVQGCAAADEQREVAPQGADEGPGDAQRGGPVARAGRVRTQRSI